MEPTGVHEPSYWVRGPENSWFEIESAGSALPHIPPPVLNSHSDDTAFRPEVIVLDNDSTRP